MYGSDPLAPDRETTVVIISHRHKFIFIKTRKTAGTSLQEALATVCGPDDVVTPTGIWDGAYGPRNFRGFVNPIPYLLDRPRRHDVDRILHRMKIRERIFDHMYLYELYRLKESRAWRGYYTFCVERNPWDKVVSRYFWRYKDRVETRPDFESFVAKLRDVSDFDLYSLDRRTVAADYVGRYEDMAGALATIGKAIGCEIPMPGQRNAGTRASRDFHDIYTPASRDRVATMFAREIDAFGYRFENDAVAASA